MKARRSDLQNIGRLLKRTDFLRVQAAAGKDASGTGRKWVTPNVIIQMAVFSPSDDKTGERCSIRLGLTVTKKIFPRSVDRNRVRRRYRALFLSIIGDFPGSCGHDFVLLPRLPALKAEAKDLEKDLRWGLKRLLSPEKETKQAEKTEK